MSVVILCGAGASYGSEDCDPEPPPLGSCLFDELQEARGVAATVGAQLANEFRDDFEAGMAEFWERRNTDVSPFLKEMARYFVDFRPGPENLYVRLANAAAESNRQVFFATTNYDLLIEMAINRAGMKISYGGRPVPPDNLPVFKIHGSCNFLPDLRGSRFEGIRFDISDAEPGAAIIAAQVQVGTPEEVVEWCENEDSIAPALSVYAEGKRVLYCPGAIEEQQTLFQDEVEAATSIFVIGLGINPADEHIWSPLANSEGELRYVGPDEDEFLWWRDQVGRRHAHHCADSFSEAAPLIIRALTR